MKNNETTFFVFIASVIIGLLISLNISFNDNQRTSMILSAQQYQEAYNLRTKLYKDISNIREQYYQNTIKLDNYKYASPTSSKILQDMTAELERNSLFLGTSEVIGKGLKITVNDASWEFDNFIDDPVVRWGKIVHNTDIMLILNSLKNSGAEAISLNGQRIISTTEVYCSGPFLSVNGVKLSAPFYLNIIGNQDIIKNYLMGESGYLKMLKYTRGIQVDIYAEDEVKIPAYVGDVKYKYMIEANN
jgi:uncharacterized protein YlxW (UPF0749 family)